MGYRRISQEVVDQAFYRTPTRCGNALDRIPVDQKEILENIQKLAENINELDENAKRFLYRVLIAYKSKTKNFYNRDIVIDPGVVQRQLRIGEGTLQSEIKLLDHAELVDLDALEYDGMLRLRYFDTEGNDLLADVYNFCLNNDRSLEKLILEPDFSQLD